jgi:RpiB/LacA/LacB family sugar-phosphate isomerase
VIASDQEGVIAKNRLAAQLIASGHDLIDVGSMTPTQACRDYAERVALCISRGEAERGVIVCGRSVRSSVAANRLPGVRAAVCCDGHSAYVGAKADGMNVLILTLHSLQHGHFRDVIDGYLSASLSLKRQERELSRAQLQKTVLYIRENLASKLSIANLARATGVNESRFPKLFKLSTGKTPHQYVMQQKIECAKAYLRETEIKLGEISTRLGFETQSHFTALFRRLEGTTPGQYRLVHQRTIADASDSVTIDGIEADGVEDRQSPPSEFINNAQAN